MGIRQVLVGTDRRAVRTPDIAARCPYLAFPPHTPPHGCVRLQVPLFPSPPPSCSSSSSSHAKGEKRYFAALPTAVQELSPEREVRDRTGNLRANNRFHCTQTQLNVMYSGLTLLLGLPCVEVRN